jgi:hypothetical protein
MGNTYKIVVGKTEGKRPLGRTRPRCEINIIMHFRKIGWEVVDWIQLAQNMDQWWAFVNAIMNLRVP